MISPDAVGAEVLTGTEKSHWLTSTDSSGDGAVRSPGVSRGFKHPLAMIGAGLVLVVVVWNLFRAPTTEVQGLAGDLVSPTPATPALLDADATAAVDDDEPTTSTTAGEDTDGVDVADLDPELTRYELFAQQGSRLLRVDLADGVVDVHEISGRLLGAFAGRLYFFEPDSSIAARPVDDLDAEPIPVAAPIESEDEVIAAALTAGGILHLTTGVFSSSGPEFSMIRLDLLTGSDQRAAVAQYGTFGLVEVPGAGLFELTGQGFRPLTDGSPRFVGERHIVVEECDTPERCRRYWFDRSTGGEVDRPVPENSTGWLLGPSGRVAVTLGPQGRSVINTETGETLSELDGFDGNRTLSNPEDMTPDERFLAVAHPTDSGDVVIHDLLRDESWALELPRTFNLSKVLFVPKEGEG